MLDSRLVEVAIPPVPYPPRGGTCVYFVKASSGGRPSSSNASTPRAGPSLDGKSPYDEFTSFYRERGREFLERLGIRRVNAECVVLDPILLGGKFKKEANRAILHRHGVL